MKILFEEENMNVVQNLNVVHSLVEQTWTHEEENMNVVQNLIVVHSLVEQT